MGIIKLGNSTNLFIDISPDINLEVSEDMEPVQISELNENVNIVLKSNPMIDSINAKFNWKIKRGDNKWDDDLNESEEINTTPVNIEKNDKGKYEIKFSSDKANPVDVLRMRLYNKGAIGFKIIPEDIAGNQILDYEKEDLITYNNPIKVDFTTGEDFKVGSAIPFKLTVCPIFKNLVVALSISEKGKDEMSAIKLWEVGENGLDISDFWNLGFGFKADYDSDSTKLIYANEIDKDEKLKFYYTISLINEKNKEENKKDSDKDTETDVYEVNCEYILEVDQPKLTDFKLSFNQNSAKVDGKITGFDSATNLITHVDLYEKIEVEGNDQFIFVGSMRDVEEVISDSKSSDSENSASNENTSSASHPEASSNASIPKSENADDNKNASNADTQNSDNTDSSEGETKPVTSGELKSEASTVIKMAEDGSITAFYPIKLIKDATKEKKYFAVLHLNNRHGITGDIPVFGNCISYLPNMAGDESDNLGFAPFLIGEENTSELSILEKATAVCSDLMTIDNLKEELESAAKFKGGYKEFVLAVAKRESGGDGKNYGKENYAGFLGRFQFGMARLMDLSDKSCDMVSRKNPNIKGDENSKFKWNSGYSKQKFLDDHDFQDRIFKKHVIKWADYINGKYKNYIGETRTLKKPYKPKSEMLKGITISEVELTLSGLIQGAHLKGYGGLAEFLIDEKDCVDGNGTHISEYIYLFSHYDLSEVLNEE